MRTERMGLPGSQFLKPSVCFLAIAPARARAPGCAAWASPSRPIRRPALRRTLGRASDRAALRASVGGRVLRNLGFLNAEHLQIRGTSVAQAIERLRANPLVEYAEPNFEVQALLTPNDPQFPLMYNLHNTGQTGGTVGADIHAVQAWDVF